MQKFILGLAGMLLGLAGLHAHAAPLSAIGGAGYPGDTVTVVLKEDASPTSLQSLTFNFTYDTTLLTYTGFVFGKSFEHWTGFTLSSIDDPSLDPDPSDTLAFVSAIFSIDLPTVNDPLLNIDGSLIGLQFSIHAGAPAGNTLVGFSCPLLDPSDVNSGCVDVNFDAFDTTVTILARGTPLPTPDTLPLVATALAVILAVRRRQRSEQPH